MVAPPLQSEGAQEKGEAPGQPCPFTRYVGAPGFFFTRWQKKNAPAGSVFFREGKKGRYGCPPGGVGTSLRAQRSVQGIPPLHIQRPRSVVTPPSSEVCAGQSLAAPALPRCRNPSELRGLCRLNRKFNSYYNFVVTPPSSEVCAGASRNGPSRRRRS